MATSNAGKGRFIVLLLLMRSGDNNRPYLSKLIANRHILNILSSFVKWMSSEQFGEKS